MNDTSRATFRKRPVVIVARLCEGLETICTLEGYMRANPGDWIVTGIRGEEYPVRDDIFRATYEPINDAARRLLDGGGENGLQDLAESLRVNTIRGEGALSDEGWLSVARQCEAYAKRFAADELEGFRGLLSQTRKGQAVIQVIDKLLARIAELRKEADDAK